MTKFVDMLILYTKPHCRYSKQVLEVLEARELEFETRDISNPELERELIERGGKLQTPYLVDTDTLTELYEAEDIVDYIHERYGQYDA